MRGWFKEVDWEVFGYSVGISALVLAVLLGWISFLKGISSERMAPELKCYAVQVDSQVAAEITGELVPISQPTQTIAKICFTEVEQ